MNKFKKIFGVVIIIMAISITFQLNISEVLADELSGREIMELVDQNQFLDSVRLESVMTIIDGRRESEKELITYLRSDGQETKANVEFINPRDRGTRYLMIDNELWMFFPNAEDLIRISGHMLEQGMMGSDFSYQDALESERLADLYFFEIIAEETLNDRPVYLVEGIARDGVEVAYYRRNFYVDTERFVVLKEEMFAREGRLLKVMEVEDVKEVIKDRWLQTKMVMEDKIRQGTETIYEIKQIEFDYDIPDSYFKLDALQ